MGSGGSSRDNNERSTAYRPNSARSEIATSLRTTSIEHFIFTACWPWRFHGSQATFERPKLKIFSIEEVAYGMDGHYDEDGEDAEGGDTMLDIDLDIEDSPDSDIDCVAVMQNRIA